MQMMRRINEWRLVTYWVRFGIRVLNHGKIFRISVPMYFWIKLLMLYGINILKQTLSTKPPSNLQISCQSFRQPLLSPILHPRCWEGQVWVFYFSVLYFLHSCELATEKGQRWKPKTVDRLNNGKQRVVSRKEVASSRGVESISLTFHKVLN